MPININFSFTFAIWSMQQMKEKGKTNMNINMKFKEINVSENPKAEELMSALSSILVCKEMNKMIAIRSLGVNHILNLEAVINSFVAEFYALICLTVENEKEEKINKVKNDFQQMFDAVINFVEKIKKSNKNENH